MGGPPEQNDLWLKNPLQNAATGQGQIPDILSKLTPEERQKLYEALHKQFDCRIYK